MTKLKHFAICLFALLFVLVFSGCGDEDETVVVPSNGQEQQNPNNNEGSENPDNGEPSDGQGQQNPNNNEGPENPDNGEPSDGQGQQNPNNNEGPENPENGEPSDGQGQQNSNNNEGPENLTFTETVNGVSFTMVAVDGGSFMMGGTEEQGGDTYDDEFPVHQVTLSGYSIGQTEVTQALWVAVMGSNPSNWQGDDLPVERVSWDDIQEFLQKLNQMTGRNYRLPTEAEWEYAARGGNKSQGYKYSGSNNIDDVAWYEDNSGNQTHTVGTKEANELGIYDMSGNVREWCQDWWSGSYSDGSQTNPTGPDSGSSRVYRGGCWYDNAWPCRVSIRYYSDPFARHGNRGFRLAL